MKSFSLLVILTLGLLLVFQSTLRAQWDDGYWPLEFKSRSGAAVNPIEVGIDSGSGFVFQALADDDNDGVIHLPPVPKNGGLALGVDTDGEVGCDLYDLVGAQLTSLPSSTTVARPLLIIAEDVEGEALGMDSGAFPLPPLRILSPGERLTAIDGRLVDWPDLRLVRADSSVTSLEDFIGRVDTLPNFNGDVIVTDYLLNGTFVPEPGAAVLFCAGALSIAARRKRSECGSKLPRNLCRHIVWTSRWRPLIALCQRSGSVH